MSAIGLTHLDASSQGITIRHNGKIYDRVYKRVIPFLLLCYVFSYLDRINVGFAKLNMQSELGFSDTVYGLGAGIFFLSYFLFEIPSNIIILKAGPRMWIARIMITWGLLSGGMMFVHSESMFYLMRFLLGAAEAGFIPGVLYYLNCWFPAAYKGKATSLFMAGIPIAGMIGAPLSGWILHGLGGVGGLSGWQWVFLIEALPSILAGFFCLYWLDNDPKSATWLSDEEKSIIAADQDREASVKQVHTIREGLKDRKTWLLSALYMTFTIGLYAVSFWLPSIIVQSGIIDPLAVGFLTALPYTAALVTMCLVGINSDRMRERRWHLAIPAFAGGLGLLVSVIFSHEPMLAVGGLTVATAGIITCIPQFYVIPPMMLSGHAAAAGFALINSVGSLAGFISPFLLGYVKSQTGSTNLGLIFVVICLLIGGSCVLLLSKSAVNR
ncbi:MFS transporter [Methylobacterium mesophilicum SR1.6/6]|uniref:MFS transporter n=1 Tax=Methylobacterium mesophilicum SR1.6/6 TaxID=908290 RepID=A0A6B9FPE7_9HYPH|nr:MFS transporter [Methylobacterium mesophilicum]QGY03606.1 MFS transporter [Methylobacterium mesophilicum SR1.6/6]